MRQPPTLRRTLAALASVLALSAASTASANMVANGSFENVTTSSTNYFYLSGVANWSNSDIGETLVTPSWWYTNTLFPNVGLAGPFPQTSPDGGNFVLSDADYHNSPIVQTISGFTPGNQYQLTFYQALAQDTEPNITTPGPVTANWHVTLGGDTQLTPMMYADGSTLSFSPWKLQTMTFTAHFATQTLSFMSMGTGDPPMAGLDGVSIIAVPEPGTVWLLSAGGLLLGWKWKQRSRARARQA